MEGIKIAEKLPLFIDSVDGRIGTRVDRRENNGLVDVKVVWMGDDARSKIFPKSEWIYGIQPDAIIKIPAHTNADNSDWEVLIAYHGRDSKFKMIIGASVASILNDRDSLKKSVDNRMSALDVKAKIIDGREEELIARRAKQSQLLSTKKPNQLALLSGAPEDEDYE